MSQTPARLVYTDSNGDQQIIGTFLPQDPTNGNISTFTIEEDAKNYKRVIIEGGPELYDRVPNTVSEFQGDEPVIKAQKDENRDGNWTDRARVYPEKGGVTNERGRYKNEHLWGFKKYHGEDDVEVTSDTNGPITTNLTDVLDALLPSGYTAQYPSDRTPPNVNNYTFNGSRQKAFNEIRKQYDHFIIFTKDTDGSEDVIVKLQPKGYGGVQFNLTRGDDAYTYNNWKKNDTSNVVSKVKVIGKDSSGSKVERVIAGGGSDSDGLHANDEEQPDVFVGEYSIIDVNTTNNTFTISGDQTEKFTDPNPIRVVNSTGNDGNYTIDDATLDVNDDTVITVEEDVTDATADGTLVNPPPRAKFRTIHVDYTITQTEADEIGENIIEPTATEHGEIEAGLNAETTLNESVGILDENRTPSNPIDDVFTVVKQKDYFHQGTTLYSFEFESEATQSQVDKWREHDSERAKVYPSGQSSLNIDFDEFEPDMTDTDPDVTSFTGGAAGAEDYSFSQAGLDSSSNQFIETTAPNLSPFTEKFLVDFNVDMLSTTNPPNDFNVKITNETTGDTYFDETIRVSEGDGGNLSATSFTIIERAAIDGDTIRGTFEIVDVESWSGTATITVDSMAQHQHEGQGDSFGTGISGSMNAVGHGNSASDFAHSLFGEGGDNNDGIIKKLIDALQELKTDR